MGTAIVNILKTVAISVVLIAVLSYLTQYVDFINVFISDIFPSWIINIIFLVLSISIAKWLVDKL